MKVKIVKYSKDQMCHRVIGEDGIERFMDIMVNGDFPESQDEEELVGREVEYESEHAYISIAMNVCLIPIDL